MIRALRIVVGMALGVAGVAAPAWGLFHLVRTPPCGSDGITVAGPPCPDDLALWIVAIVGSVTIVLPLAIAVAGSLELGRPLLWPPIVVLTPLCALAGVAFSLLGPTSDPDTRWVGWVVAAVALTGALGAVRPALRAGTPAALTARARPTPRPPEP